MGKDIDLLVNKILPFLKYERQEEYKAKIKEVFERYKQLLNKYFNIDEFQTKNVSLSIRRDLESILEEISEEVSKDYYTVNLSSIINGVFENASQDYNTFLLKTINEIANKVKKLIVVSNQEEYLVQLNEILNGFKDGDVSQQLIEIIMKLYKLQFSIEAYMKELSDIDNHKYDFKEK